MILRQPSASMLMHPPSSITNSNIWPCSDLDLDPNLQNLISSSVASTTSSAKVWWNSNHWFVRYRANRTPHARLDGRTEAPTDGQAENIMHPPHLSAAGGGIKTNSENTIHGEENKQTNVLCGTYRRHRARMCESAVHVGLTRRTCNYRCQLTSSYSAWGSSVFVLSVTHIFVHCHT